MVPNYTKDHKYFLPTFVNFFTKNCQLLLVNLEIYMWNVAPCWNRLKIALICISQNGQTHFKDLEANVERFLKCVRPFRDIMH